MPCVYVVVVELRSLEGAPVAAYAYASVYCNDRAYAVKRADSRLAMLYKEREVVSVRRVMRGMEARVVPAWVPVIEASRINKNKIAFILRTSLESRIGTPNPEWA